MMYLYCFVGQNNNILRCSYSIASYWTFLDPAATHALHLRLTHISDAVCVFYGLNAFA